MTIHNLLLYCNNKLKQASIEKSDFESELLLSYILKKNRTYIISHPKDKVSVFKAIKLAYLCQKRAQNTPLAYIFREKHFYNLSFIVNKNVLIPRPESEFFIDYFKKFDYNNSLVLDIGTGSGALIISLIKNLNLESFNNYHFIATDISKKALKVAKKNAKRHKALKHIDFKQSNLLSKISDKSLNKHQNIYILANLPYLNSQEMEEKSIKKEPKTALYSQNNGLKHYLRLLQEIKSKINNDKNIILAMEINPGQKEVLINEINNTFLKPKIDTVKDYSNNDRLIVVKIKQS
ncbi:peptide chain release factor N(5)-glutamine methyltransferase [Patescibacteria group bacterium]|nr:peptide chain release factor N(5)-glutamine methyltransferase [Patescibacteria group bacterium]